MVDTEVTTKVCSKCNESKFLSEFHRDSGFKSGVKARCKSCISVEKKLYWDENKESRMDYDRRYKEANKEAISNARSIYYENNKDYLRQCSSEYLKRNKHLHNARQSRRRAITANAIPKHLETCPLEKSSVSNTYLLAKLVSECTGVNHHVDHMWPLADGGPHWSGNLQIIPAEDNLRKHAKVCENTKATIKESLEWEIQRYNNERLDT
jgi:hypothetical protein